MIAGKTKLKKYAIAALVLSAILMPLFSGSVSADVTDNTETDTCCINECDGQVVSGYLDMKIDDFNKATVDWSLGGCSAEAVTETDCPPYKAFEGSRSLLVTPKDGKTPEITAKTSIASANECKFFIVSLYFPDNSGDTAVTVSVTAKKSSFTRTVRVSGGGWRTVCADISDAGLSGKISSVKMSFETEKAFLIDTCGFSSSERADYGIRLSADRYMAFDCSSNEQKDRISVTLSGENAYIETQGLRVTDFSGGIGIRVKYNNLSNCRTLTLGYTTLSSVEFSERLSVTKSVSSGTGSVMFPIPEAYIGKIRIRFDGDCNGEFEIMSVCRDACYITPSYDGAVTDCRITQDGRSITVSGEIREENVKKYSGCSIYLYELGLNEEIGGITLGDTAKAEAVLNGGSFAFTFPMSDSREELFRKYAVLVFSSGVLVPLGEGMSVTNPEILADEHGEYSTSVKGIYPVSAPSVLDGTAHTAIRVDLGKLVTNSADNAVFHRISNEKTYSFDEKYVLELDEKMKELDNCGIGVTFVLYVSDMSDISLEGRLCHPLSDIGHGSVMFNTASGDGIDVLRTVCDFLAKRYSLTSGMTDNAEGFTVGSRVNAAYENCNMGMCDLTQFTKAYSAALRTVYNAAKQVNSGLSVYISLGNSWSNGSLAYPVGSFDAETVLESVAACIKQGGDIEWKLAYDTTVRDGVFGWEAPSGRQDVITAENLEILVNATAYDGLTYSGAARQIMLLGADEITPADENEYIKYCAEFVCTYLKISQRAFDRIRIYIPSHPVNYGNVYENIDTDGYGAATAFAGEIFGKELYEALTASAGTSVVRRHTETGTAATQIPSSVKSETRIFDFTHDTDGWYRAVGCTTLKGSTDVDGKGGLLSASFGELPPESYRGIAVDFEKNIDISAADYVCFEAKAAVLPNENDELELTAVFVTADGYVSSVTKINGKSWTLAVCKLPERIKNSGCRGMTVYIRGVDGKDIGEPTLLIGDVRALSDVRSEKELEEAIRPDDRRGAAMKTVTVERVAAVGAVFVAATVLEAARIVYKKKHGDTDKENM